MLIKKIFKNANQEQKHSHIDQEVELSCQQLGYINCNQENKSPYYFEVYSGSQITFKFVWYYHIIFVQHYLQNERTNFQLNSAYLVYIYKKKENDCLFQQNFDKFKWNSQTQFVSRWYQEKPAEMGSIGKIKNVNLVDRVIKHVKIHSKVKFAFLIIIQVRTNYACYTKIVQVVTYIKMGPILELFVLEILLQLVRNVYFVGIKESSQSRYSNYCQGSPSQQYLSMDGKNSRLCNIHYFDYIILLQTSFDINVKLELSFIYKGELKQQNNDCQFAIIQNEDYKKICPINKTNYDSVQVSNCLIPNCILCIPHYTENDFFYIQSQDGYFSKVLSGQIIQCGQTCKTCIQQNKKYRDYWKWSIRAFYQFVINNNNDHPFEKYASRNSESDLNLFCTSCRYGLILYDQKCMSQCDKFCNKYEIIDEKATFIQCLETISGFMKSQNENGSVLQCPSNWKVCMYRGESEVKEVNPYFISKNQNNFQTRICYEKSQASKKQENYYYSYLFPQIQQVVTNMNNVIIKLFTLKPRGTSTYYEQQQLSNDEYFESMNVFFCQLFWLWIQKSLETSQLFDYLNFCKSHLLQIYHNQKENPRSLKLSINEGQTLLEKKY
ncbi:unnamed protein product [Paramecium primaurelia]|uniref:Uncharacterized protein n=1 Tax=Paramecium primaurelia TaxID=5886 RepID=A0A8S1QJX6_PARPR|nr:unnamed protein product [Paramecium primaurelia]